MAMYSRAASPVGTGSSVRFGKKNLSSRVADAGESDPCVAFWVPSVPNLARKDLGASSRAVKVFVGPINARQSLMASFFARQHATIGPLDMNRTRFG